MRELFEIIVVGIEATAVALLLIGLIISTGRYCFRIVGRQGSETAYRGYRQELGRTLMLTLELLIAADIIDTVAVEKSVESLGLLAGLVLIRTFLSFALELDVTGRWPWQRSDD
jgi:uncharacterized membrane protein